MPFLIKSQVPIVFLFSGHGTQYYHMGIELYNQHSSFKKWMDYQDAIAREIQGYSITETLYNPFNKKSEAFDSIQYTHIALFMVQYSLAQCLKEDNIKPDFLIGSSLGEYIALAVSEAFPLKDMLKMLLQQVDWLKAFSEEGGMLSILEDYNKYKNLPIILENSEIAAVNYSHNFAVAGRNKSLKVIEKFFEENGTCYRLPIRYPFHSSIIDALKEPHISHFKQIKINSPKIPTLSCAVCGQVNEVTGEYLWDIVRKPILFMETIKKHEKQGPFIYVDMSPSATLSNFLKKTLDDKSESKFYNILSPFQSKENQNYKNLLNDFKHKEYLRRRNEKKMKAIVFPGQGSQKVGMGGNLFDEFKEITQMADQILGYSIKELCLTNSSNNLDQTEYTQPAIYTVNALHYLKIQNEGQAPDFVAGHSLGEYNALLASGAFSFEDGLKMVVRRSKLMAQATSGGMAAIIGLSEEEIKNMFHQGSINSLDVANYNSPSQVVIAGIKEDLERFGDLVSKYGKGRYVPLRVSGSFHSRYMTDSRNAFNDYLSGFKFNEPKIPTIANFNALPYSIDSMQAVLANQINSSVKWNESIQYMLNEGVTEFIEVGGHVILTRMIDEIKKTHVVRPNKKMEDSKHETVKLANDDVKNEKIQIETKMNQVGSKKQSDSINNSISSTSRTKVGLISGLCSQEFLEDYGIKYPYVCGGMYHGISSSDLVIRAAKAGMMAYFGTGGLKLDEIKRAIAKILEEIKTGFGMSFTPHQLDNQYNNQLIDLFLDNKIRNIEASGFINIVPAIVKFRLKGLKEGTNSRVVSENKIMAKLSRPEIAMAFLSPAPQNIVNKLLEDGEITKDEALLSQKVALADDICVEADSGGHTDQGNAFVLLPAILRMADELYGKYQYTRKVRVGLGGGIGTPDAVAAAFLLGAGFVVTGSVNQCTIEAGISDLSKELLSAMNVQDTDYAPAGDMFELGAKVQVLKKGVFFPARANRLYEAYKFYNSVNDMNSKLKDQIQNLYFGKSFEAVYEDVKNYYGKRHTEELDGAEKNPKQKMSLIFRQYFRLSAKAALEGDPKNKVNYQILCGPALGALNQWVKSTDLAHWSKRHVDEIGLRMMDEADQIIRKRISLLDKVK